MKIECAYDELRAVGDLREHPRNPNTHPARQVEMLAKIIRETGWRSPIVVSARSGFVVKGHGRLLAARLAGFAEAPVDVQEYESEAQELADMVADNRIAELAEMDGGLLDQVLVDLRDEGWDMELAGFGAQGTGQFEKAFSQEATVKEILFPIMILETEEEYQRFLVFKQSIGAKSDEKAFGKIMEMAGV
jgi:hypothetical protein